MPNNNLMEKLVSLLKQRGFIWQSSEIYGGAASAYDYGPLGVLLKNNLKNFWLKSMLKSDLAIVPLDSSIFMRPEVWRASGHVENFIDPLVECSQCRKRFKASEVKNSCPDCRGALSQPKVFNLMFQTNLGPVKDSASTVYLRPETAQGIYADWMAVQKSMRLKIPFGIAQVGKAFRNEITPSNFTYRTVEFEQMEQQFFVRPEEASHWFSEWKQRRLDWYIHKLGFKKENIRLRPHQKKELAHYAVEAEDIEYQFPFGWHEIEGIHNRGDWDLSQHQKYSGKDLSYFDEETKEKFLPHIIETSAGADRVMLAMLLDGYYEEVVKKEERVVLKLHPYLAPYRLAVFPLVRTDKALVDLAGQIFKTLKAEFSCYYDEKDSIGRRYRRQDEIGTPWCVTVDGDSLKGNTVTIRDRDSLAQERVKIGDLTVYIKAKVAQSIGLGEN